MSFGNWRPFYLGLGVLKWLVQHIRSPDTLARDIPLPIPYETPSIYDIDFSCPIILQFYMAGISLFLVFKFNAVVELEIILYLCTIFVFDWNLICS